jgi:hypothetical protein
MVGAPGRYRCGFRTDRSAAARMGNFNPIQLAEGGGRTTGENL